MTSADIGAERLDVKNIEDKYTFDLAVANGDPKLMAWDVLDDEREVAEQDLERKQLDEIEATTFPDSDYPFSSLIEHRHAQERCDLADKFAKQYRSFIHVVDSGGEAADATIADMRVRQDAIQEIISDRDDVILEAARRSKRTEGRRAQIQRNEKAQHMARHSAQVIPLVGYEALKAGDARRAEKAQEAPKIILAKPFVCRDPKTIPPRRWLYGHHLARGYTGVTFAPGAGCKTSLTLLEDIEKVTGKDLSKTGQIGKQPLKVWIYNGEDPDEEIERRIAAIRQYYGVADADIEGRLFVNSGRDTGLKIVVQDGKNTRIVKPEVDQVIAQMLALEIDVLTIDPAVSFHSIPENDNTAMDMFAKEWNYIAGKTNAAIHLLHHVRKGAKGQEYEFTVEDGRGAVALLAASRAARVNNFMSSDEAAKYGIDERDRMNYFRVDGGKPNMAARSDGRARWYQMVSVNLGNDDGDDPADDVGVAINWQPTEAADSVATPTLVEIAERLENGDHGHDGQAKDWAGYVVGDVLKLDPVWDKPKIKAMLKSWIRAGSLVVVRKEVGNKGKERPFVKKGTIVDSAAMVANKMAKMAGKGGAKAVGEANDLTIMTTRAPAEVAGEPDHDPVTGEVFEPEAAPVEPGGEPDGIPFMVTKKMRRDLNARGFTEEQIDEMSPETAWQLLAT